MAEYIVAIDVTRVRFPADACDCNNQTGKYPNLQVLCNNADVWGSNPRSKTPGPRESRPMGLQGAVIASGLARVGTAPLGGWHRSASLLAGAQTICYHLPMSTCKEMPSSHVTAYGSTGDQNSLVS